MKNGRIHFLIVPLLIITTETAYGMDSDYYSYANAKMLIGSAGLGFALSYFWGALHNKFFPPTVRGTFDAKYLKVNRSPDWAGPLELIVDYKGKKAHQIYFSYDVQMQEKNNNGEPVWKIKLSSGDTVEYNPKTDTSVIQKLQ
jgi:hypothetical protein